MLSNIGQTFSCMKGLGLQGMWLHPFWCTFVVAKEAWLRYVSVKHIS